VIYIQPNGLPIMISTLQMSHPFFVMHAIGNSIMMKREDCYIVIMKYIDTITNEKLEYLML
jgi:hypothetical protein